MKNPRQKHIRKSFFLRATSVFLIVCLSVMNTISYAAPLQTPPAAEINISEKYGTLDESFFAGSPKTVIYIQDAHDSLEAQENIAKIIGQLVKKSGVKTVFEEGYEGPVPTDKFFGVIKDGKTREKVSYFLLDHLRIGGAEYAHINRKTDFRLIGADNTKLHLENISWYHKSAKTQRQVQSDLKKIFHELENLAKQYFPKELKEWMKNKEKFEKGELSILDYLKRTAQDPSPTISLLLKAEGSKDPQILEKVQEIEAKTLFREIDLMEESIAANLLKNDRDRKIFHFYKTFSLLKRLNRIEVTPAEYEALKNSVHTIRTQDIAQFIADESRKSLALSKRWEEDIQNAVRFYETARARDASIEVRLEEFLKSPDEETAILVFGGFHKDEIKDILHRKHLSYHIVSPKISETDTKHRDYYRRLMSRGYEPFRVPALLSRASRYPPVFVEAASTQGADQTIQQILVLAENLASESGDLRSEMRTHFMKESDKAELRHLIESRSWFSLTDEDQRAGKTIQNVLAARELPLVIKIPRQHVSRHDFDFALESMGGLMAPLTILDNVTVRGTVYPFVLVQKKLEVIHNTSSLPDSYTLESGKRITGLHAQEKELILESVRRGLFLADALIAKNYGIDTETGKLFFADHMDAMPGSFGSVFPLKNDGYPRLGKTLEEKAFPREFYKGWVPGHLEQIGIPSDLELSKIWSIKPGIYPVDDVSLPARSELRSVDGISALKTEPKTLRLRIPDEERENLKRAAATLVQKIHDDPRNLREVIVVPGSGFWAAEIVKRVWTQNYPDEKINFYDMASADFESQLEALSKMDKYLLVLDDSALTMRAATAIRKILETKIAAENLIFSALYAGDYAADPEGFYPAGDPMGPAAKQAYPYLYDGRFLFGLKNQRALEQGFPVWHLVRRFGKSGSISENPQSIAAQLPDLAQSVLAAREEILKNFRATGGDPDILNFDERRVLNERLEKAGMAEAESYLKTYLPDLLDVILKEPARSELRNLNEEVPKALQEIVGILNLTWNGKAAHPQANLVLLAEAIEELPHLTQALMALEASIESPSVKNTDIYRKLLHNDLAAVNRAIAPANYVILYHPAKTQEPFSLTPLPLQKIVSVLNRGWAGDANKIQGELIRLAEELTESDQLEPWLMGVVTSIQELKNSRVTGDRNTSDARLRTLITGSLQSDLRELNEILASYQHFITYDPTALEKPFDLLFKPESISSDEKNPTVQRSELRSPSAPENSGSSENIPRRTLERYVELLSETASLAEFERIRELLINYLDRLSVAISSGNPEAIRQLAISENTILEREAQTFRSMREDILTDADYLNLKNYLEEDSATRADTNPISASIRTSVENGLESFVEMVGSLKINARRSGFRTGVINIMLHEATHREEDLRNKVSEYYTLLRREKSRAGKNFSPEKLEALNTIRWMGIGDIITTSPESRLAKAGGLADVMRELPEGLAKSGASITVVSFLYEKEQAGRPGENGRHKSADVIIREEGLKKEAYQLKIHIGPTKHSGSDTIKDPARDILADVYTKSTGDLHEVYLSIPGKTEVLYPGNLSASELLDLALLLSRGTLEYARAEGIYPHAILTNDWMASLIPLYLRVDAFDTSYKSDPHFRETISVAVGHNLGRAYQLTLATNEFTTDIFPKLEIPGEHYSGISDEPIDNTHMNLVKANFYHITNNEKKSGAALLVSPKYLEENLRDGSVSKLEWLLREHSQNAYGISNGIDDEKWRADYDKLGRELAGMPPGEGAVSQESYVANLFRYKSAAKLHIQKKYAAAGPSEKFFGSLVIDKNKTLIGLAARLAEQKGIELFVEGARQILDSDPTAQIVIAGSVPKTGPEEPEAIFERAMIELAGNEQYKGRFVFHPEFIEPKLLFLGLDFFLMPSKDEPGGIAQLQALLAGAGVIGRATGGIANSVRQFNPNTRQGDGFLFEVFKTQAFVHAVSQALTVFRDQKNRDAIRNNAATADNSWEKSSRFYLSFFQNAAGVLKDDYPHLKSVRERLRAIQPHLNHPKASSGGRSELRQEVVTFKGKKLENISINDYEGLKTILQFLRTIPGITGQAFSQILNEESPETPPVLVEQLYEREGSKELVLASEPLNLSNLFHGTLNTSLQLFRSALINASSNPARDADDETKLLNPHYRAARNLSITVFNVNDPTEGNYIKILIEGKGTIRSELRNLLANDAREWAKILEDADPLRVFGDALSITQKRAYAQLHNYDIDKLLSDFAALPVGSRKYDLTVTAISYTLNLVAFKKIRELAMSLDPAADAQRIKDLSGALRHIQYEIFLNIEGGDREGKTTNRRTWEGRTALSYSVMDQEVDKYERLNQNMVIGDFAVSDGTSAYELAQRYQNRKIPVKIAAYDKVFGFYLFPNEGVTYAFDNTGKFTEAIYRNQIFFDDTIPPANAQEAFGRLSEEQKNNFYVSLINPEAEIFSREHPDLLEFKLHDVFKPLPAEHDFIRVSGLLMRGRFSYFSDDQIKAALGLLGASLKEGGRLLNGTFWGNENSPTGQYDLFERQGDSLILKTARSPQGQEINAEGWERIDLDTASRSELRSKNDDPDSDEIPAKMRQRLSTSELTVKITALIDRTNGLREKIRAKLAEAFDSDILITRAVVTNFGKQLSKIREDKIRLTDSLSISQQKHSHARHLSDVIDAATEELDNLRSASYSPDQFHRSELRKTALPKIQKNNKGTLLMDADDAAALTSRQKDELFSALYMNRSELRLVLYDNRGQLDTDKSLKAITKLSNTFTSSGAASKAMKRYGIPKSMIVSISNQENSAKAQGALGVKLRGNMKFVRLKKEVGKIILAELLARNGALWNDLIEKDGFVEPRTEGVLATIARQRLAHMVVAYAA